MIVCLVLILLGALTYLFCQNYLVYDDQGKVHLELPWSEGKIRDGQDENPISPDDVSITREDPPQAKVAELQGKELPFERMEQSTADLLNEKALVVQVSRYDGSIAYQTAVTLPESISRGSSAALNNLKALLAGDGYAVAEISCLANTAYAHAQMEQAGLLRDDRGDVWYDIHGECWLDPTKPGTLSYITALCKECVELGFDEIMLDNFSYPTTGNVARIFYGEGSDRVAALTDFAQELRKALPADTVLSVTLRTPLSANGGESGVTAQLLQSFDRVYVDTTAVDTAAVTAALPAEYVIPGRIVPMVRETASSGSYLLTE